MNTYYTHAGVFHADEVTGCAICELAEVTETFKRLVDIEGDLLHADGVVADIGREYDVERLRFDHHQGLILRDNGVPYASAGLLWKEYGARVVINTLIRKVKPTELNDKLVARIKERVDLVLIQGIDAHDADQEYHLSATCRAGEVRVHSLSNVVSMFNGDPKDHFNQSVNFRNAVHFMRDILENQVKSAYEYILDEDRFDDLLLQSEVGCVGILKESVRWKEIVHARYQNIIYLITPSAHPGNQYSMFAVPINPTRREVKVPIERPDWFKGFIHQGKWIAGSNNIEELELLAKWNYEKFLESARNKGFENPNWGDRGSSNLNIPNRFA